METISSLLGHVGWQRDLKNPIIMILRVACNTQTPQYQVYQFVMFRCCAFEGPKNDLKCPSTKHECC